MHINILLPNLATDLRLCLCLYIQLHLRVGLQGDESEDISNYMKVDMLLSQDESRNDRMLRAELRNNNMQRLQTERRLHPTQGTADVAGSICKIITYLQRTYEHILLLCVF